MNGPDRRTILARPDLAAAGLEGLVRAARFTALTAMQLVLPASAIRRAPDRAAEQVDQLLLGELFDVAEVGAVWCWGQARRDGYVGHVETAALAPAVQEVTHTVSARATFAFAEASIKAPALGPISLGAFVAVEETRGPLARAAGVGWLPVRHLRPIGAHSRDPAAVAEALLGAPYLWGGRSSQGLDCSGLVQQALHACGRAAPRDADQQAALGEAVRAEDLARSDLIFWRGHVAILVDEEHIIHANAHHMAVAIEPLAEATTRIRQAAGDDPIAWRRL